MIPMRKKMLPCAITLLKERNLLSAMTNDNLANILNAIASDYRNGEGSSSLKSSTPPSVATVVQSTGALYVISILLVLFDFTFNVVHGTSQPFI